MAVGGRANHRQPTDGSSHAHEREDTRMAAMQATVTQAASDLDRLVEELERAAADGSDSATVSSLDARAREAFAYLQRAVTEHERAATEAGYSDARAAAVRNGGRLDALDRRLRAARRAGARAGAKADRAALLDGGAGSTKTRGKSQAAVSDTLRAAKAQLGGNIDAGLEALKQLKADSDKMKEVDSTFGGLERELDTGTSILKRFKSRDCVDRMYIGLALTVYCIVVAWIIYRRLGLHRIVMLVATVSDLIFGLMRMIMSTIGIMGGDAITGDTIPDPGPDLSAINGHVDL
eukprot:m.189046 g.189046  ORF g.189046 m.189046 type:complete len:292 (+) comp17612_c0_seq1:214-1089(+)